MKLRNLLALGLLLALTPLSAALAEGDDTTEPVTIGIDEDTPAEERTQARDVGNITVMGDRGIPVAWVIVEAQGQGTIRAEDVTVEATEWANAIGAQVNATASGAQATVEAKKIAATTKNEPANGVQMFAADDGTVAVIAEAVTATATESEAWGVSATATYGGAATVQVTGQDGVQVEGRSMSFGVRLTARGTDAVIQAQVAGDIDVQSSSNTKGAYVTAFTGGEIELACGGSVLAEGDGAIALDVAAMEGGAQATVTVAGDVVATGDGAIGLIVQAEDTGTVEVLVEGTISGDDAAVQVWGAGTEEAATLTVWALEGEIVGARGGDAEAFAQRIQYILKADPIEGGDVALDGATKYKDFDVATVGTTVTMLPNLAEGYILLGVNNNDTALAKDEDGHFFLEVPQGGGVYLTYFVESRHGNWPLPLPVYIPVRCLGKVSSGDALLKFYDVGTFEIIRNGQSTVGYYGFEDGCLTLRAAVPLTLAENGDRSVTVALGDLVFTLDAATVATLPR